MAWTGSPDSESGRTLAGEIQIPSQGERNYTLGFFDDTGSYHDCPLWRMLGHELCGHALFRLGNEDQTWGDRPDHDETVKIENTIAREHAVPTRGLYSDLWQGESTWRRSEGQTVYFRNKPWVSVPGRRRAADYRLIIA